MKHTALRMLIAFFALFLTSPAFASGGQSATVTAAEAQNLLTQGNERFVAGKPLHLRQDDVRRQETVENGQHPFVTVLGCSDSRVPPEILFDQGIGDIFVVRVAGNVANTDEIASIEYGVEHLGTPLLLVLGHMKCGAVTAVVSNAEAGGSIPQLLANIKRAVARIRNDIGASDEEFMFRCIRSNVWQSVEDTFRNSAIVRELVESGKLKVMGAVYEPLSGKVIWMGEHPEQERLLTPVPEKQPKPAPKKHH